MNMNNHRRYQPIPLEVEHWGKMLVALYET
jgi:hypothetical protein